MSQRATLKAKLRAREPMFACFCSMPSPDMVEMIGYAGFDYVIIDAEHGTISPETMVHMIRAADVAGIPALVRVPSASEFHILGVLEMGAAGVQVPHVRNADQAREIVKHALYSPLGERGISSRTRAAMHGMVRPADYLSSQAQQTSIVLMIEDAATIPEVDAIARVPGVDAIFVGPSDLSASLGRIGNPKHPDVVAALDTIHRKVLAAEGPALATTIQTAADIPAIRAAGATALCLNAVYILATRLQAVVKELHPEVRP
ncbi:HpcH/HpaI aldolase family protein [Neoroseomonas lacus]|uniref:2-dehydro-3-deoxyglucarate aldolase n=1 Tax=Neoroseomonas lacus TaxID=287609 RepID=A0A917NJP6_9PROT|nr:aldolase/citrate lyase family protein [Neoroseomonas lacus]GGJ05544.1 2-dehydro-3-deoxyglucarate aldolase [Neoroseomonas lacus]